MGSEKSANLIFGDSFNKMPSDGYWAIDRKDLKDSIAGCPEKVLHFQQDASSASVTVDDVSERQFEDLVIDT